jgi:hypothetical protein
VTILGHVFFLPNEFPEPIAASVLEALGRAGIAGRSGLKTRFGMTTR